MRSRWMALIGHRAAAVERAQGGHHHVPDRREGDRRVQRHRRPLVGPPGPDGSERERPGALALRAGADVDLAAHVPRYLQGAERRGAEAVEAEPPAGGDPAEPERPMPDDPAAEQRREGDVVGTLGQGGGELRPHHHPLGEPAVAVPAGEDGVLAQVLAPGPAAASRRRRRRPASRRRPGRPRASRGRPAPSAATRPTAWWPGTIGSRRAGEVALGRAAGPCGRRRRRRPPGAARPGRAAGPAARAGSSGPELAGAGALQDHRAAWLDAIARGLSCVDRARPTAAAIALRPGARRAGRGVRRHPSLGARLPRRRHALRRPHPDEAAGRAGGDGRLDARAGGTARWWRSRCR